MNINVRFNNLCKLSHFVLRADTAFDRTHQLVKIKGFPMTTDNAKITRFFCCLVANLLARGKKNWVRKRYMGLMNGDKVVITMPPLALSSMSDCLQTMTLGTLAAPQTVASHIASSHRLA